MNQELRAQQVEILQERITNGQAQLLKEVAAGNRAVAHTLVNDIIDAQRDLEDMGAKPYAGTHEANFTA